MKKKTYLTPLTDTVYIPASTPLMAGSVMTPGQDNEDPGAPGYIGDYGNGSGF